MGAAGANTPRDFKNGTIRNAQGRLNSLLLWTERLKTPSSAMANLVCFALIAHRGVSVASRGHLPDILKRCILTHVRLGKRCLRCAPPGVYIFCMTHFNEKRNTVRSE